jgi:ABC-type transport system involved in Fe-S cluster assembly fused permease/ATPase subunit
MIPSRRISPYGEAAGASRKEIERAAEAAHALEFIRAMPQGFDTLIGENGVRLSGGQRQRLAIARTVLKGRADPDSGRGDVGAGLGIGEACPAALEYLMQGRTTVVIAHRLSTIENADRIVVLDKGRYRGNRNARGIAGQVRDLREPLRHPVFDWRRQRTESRASAGSLDEGCS